MRRQAVPGLPLREAVGRLTDSTSIEPRGPLPGLPPTREQRQQAQRLDAAAAAASARVMDALGSQRPLIRKEHGTRPNPAESSYWDRMVIWKPSPGRAYVRFWPKADMGPDRP